MDGRGGGGGEQVGQTVEMVNGPMGGLGELAVAGAVKPGWGGDEGARVGEEEFLCFFFLLKCCAELRAQKL